MRRGADWTYATNGTYGQTANREPRTANRERRTANGEPLLGDGAHGFAPALVGFLGRMARLQGDTLIGSEIG